MTAPVPAAKAVLKGRYQYTICTIPCSFKVDTVGLTVTEKVLSMNYSTPAVDAKSGP